MTQMYFNGLHFKTGDGTSLVGNSSSMGLLTAFLKCPVDSHNYVQYRHGDPEMNLVAS